MIYQEIEELAKTPEGLNKILSDLTPTIKQIEDFVSELSVGKYTDGKEATKLLMQSTGLWDELKIIHTVLDTHKTNKELGFFLQQKMEIEAGEKKFNVSATSKEAAAHVVAERRVRNVVEAYMSTAEKNIIACQSLLKYLTETHRRVNAQEG